MTAAERRLDLAARFVALGALGIALAAFHLLYRGTHALTWVLDGALLLGFVLLHGLVGGRVNRVTMTVTWALWASLAGWPFIEHALSTLGAILIVRFVPPGRAARLVAIPAAVGLLAFAFIPGSSPLTGSLPDPPLWAQRLHTVSCGLNAALVLAHAFIVRTAPDAVAAARSTPAVAPTRAEVLLRRFARLVNWALLAILVVIVLLFEMVWAFYWGPAAFVIFFCALLLANQSRYGSHATTAVTNALWLSAFATMSVEHGVVMLMAGISVWLVPPGWPARLAALLVAPAICGLPFVQVTAPFKYRFDDWSYYPYKTICGVLALLVLAHAWVAPRRGSAPQPPSTPPSGA